MTDNATNVSSETVAQPAALKSTDTLKSEPAPEAGKPAEEPVKAQKQIEAKPEQSGNEAPPEGEEKDDAPAAAAPERKEQRLPRWMKERLERERQVTAARTREQVLRELQAQQQPAQTQAQTPSESEREKGLEDFDFDFVAYQKYLAKQAIEVYKREEQQRAEQQKQAEVAEQFKAKVDSFESRVGAGAWEDIEASKLNTDPAYKPLVELFLGDDHDLDIAHHLAQHIEEADRLLSLSPLQRVREVAKLAEKFSDPATAEVAAVTQPPKKTTNAPPPPKTVSGAGKPSVDVRSPEISTADRIRAWKATRG